MTATLGTALPPILRKVPECEGAHFRAYERRRVRVRQGYGSDHPSVGCRRDAPELQSINEP
jgi:hypothetical protein